MTILTQHRSFLLLTRNKFSRRRQVIARSAPIVPEYFDFYVRYVCKASDCLDHAIFPPEEKQMEIVQKLATISDRINISGVEQHVFKLLSIEDTQLLNQFLTELQKYQDARQVLSAIAEVTSHISFEYDISRMI